MILPSLHVMVTVQRSISPALAININLWNRTMKGFGLGDLVNCNCLDTLPPYIKNLYFRYVR